MAECDACGKSENMPYECKRCGGSFCTEHRLPEAHDCPGLNAWSGGEGGGALGGGPSAGGPNAGQGPSASGGVGSIGTSDDGLFDMPTGTGGWRGYFRNNMTFVFLLAMWITFVAQWAVILFVGGDAHQLLFTSSTEHPEAVWTYVTSIFAHSPVGLWHIAFNSIALYFFGPIVEKKLGSKRFVILFIGSGIIASVGSVGISLLLGQSMTGLGASGAVLGVLGVLTILNPDLRVLLFFAIPMPLWVLTTGVALVSIFFIASGSPGAFSVGHAAHLFGLLAGLVYGQYLKQQGMTAPRQLQFGGGGGGMGGGGRRRF